MNRKSWKPYYLKSGKYEDGRERIVIAWYDEKGFRKIKALPKPEILRDLLGDGDRSNKFGSKKGVENETIENGSLGPQSERIK
jgi:hypothetical protein